MSKISYLKDPYFASFFRVEYFYIRSHGTNYWEQGCSTFGVLATNRNLSRANYFSQLKIYENGCKLVGRRIRKLINTNTSFMMELKCDDVHLVHGTNINIFLIVSRGAQRGQVFTGCWGAIFLLVLLEY